MQHLSESIISLSLAMVVGELRYIKRIPRVEKTGPGLVYNTFC
jgi:hypothetical protein